MQHHDDGKTVIIEVNKENETSNKDEDITLTHSSLFPVKAKGSSFFRNPLALAGTLLLLLIVAVFLLISSIGNSSDNPNETSSSVTDEANPPPIDPDGSLHVIGISEAAHITGGVYSDFALLAEVDSLKAIAVKNANEIMYPASLTKIMTFLVAYDALSDKLDKQLSLTQEIRSQYPEGSRVPIDAIGDLLTVEQCMYAMLLESDTDAVLMLATAVAGSEEAFVALMNEKATELGLTRTHFTNANGLHHEDHYTTPAEMAVIFAHALKNELFHTIITTHTYVTYLGYHKDGEYATYRMTFFNSTLKKRFEGNQISTTLPNGLTIVGGKTGWTDEAGLCQAALAVDASGKEHIAILGNAASAKESALDTATLYETYIK